MNSGLLALFSALSLSTLTVTPSAPLRFDWRLAELQSAGVKFWQPVTPNSIFRITDPERRGAEALRRVSDDDLREGGTHGCPAGMVRVRGEMRDPNETLARQNRACLDGPGWNPVYLCQNFDPAALGPENQPSLAMDFCIDRYEFPNVPGEFPATMLSWNDATRICALEGKGLCSEDQWTFACEGPEAWPYPYGYARYPEAGAHFPDHIPAGDGCNIDVIRHVHSDMALMMAHRYEAAGLAEIDRLWNGVPAGSRGACSSPFGVKDLTGNIEEWTVQSPGRPVNYHGAPSVLKGGYWSPVRSRCQTAELAHGVEHEYYQTGFRCCLKP